ncbi:MAG: NAD kinase, partial [Alphaproteobacteria bacterium]|nr:NAD kinase [Alphaproteobacteria bacterium]
MENKIAFFVADVPQAKEAYERFLKTHKNYPISEANVAVVLGGDGYLLRTLHRFIAEDIKLPVYGLNRGSMGFLLNDFKEEDLDDRLKSAISFPLFPLKMVAEMASGK